MKPRKPVSRLTNPKVLRQIDRGLLRRLLEKFSDFMQRHQIDFPPATKKRGDYDFTKLSKALLENDERPEQLLLALEAVGTMADVHGAEILQRSLIQESGETAPDKKAVAADLALRAYLDDRDVFDSALMEKRVVDTRRYRCFTPAFGIEIQKADFSDAKMLAIEAELSAFFGDPDKGCEIIPSGQSSNIRWFIVIHGGRRRREATFEKGERQHVEFHPETDDVVRINSATGEMWIHSKTKSESEAYRKSFGRNLLDEEEAFIRAGRLFTLEPLRARGRDSLITTDIESCPIESIELRELEIVLDSANQTIWKMSSKNNIFDNLDRFGGIPRAGQIRAARFLVRFEGSRKQTRVTIRLPADADYERDSDSEWIEMWLRKQKFRLENPDMPASIIQNAGVMADAS
jgi:hypothetical protein